MVACLSLLPPWDAGASPRLAGASCDFPVEGQWSGGMEISNGVSTELTDPTGISHPDCSSLAPGGAERDCLLAFLNRSPPYQQLLSEHPLVSFGQ